MEEEFPKPYSIDEIRKDPMAVAFSIVTGLLLICVGIIIKKDIREQRLLDKADKEKTQRIEMYENMIFYKGRIERMETAQKEKDSLVRERTEPFVNKILNNEK